MAEVLQSLSDLTVQAIVPVEPANDNMNAENLADMMKNTFAAIPTMEKVREMVQDEIIEFNCLNKIELKIGDVMQTLPEQPRHYLFQAILQATAAEVPAALIGPAGAGKSTICLQIAQALSLKFYLQNSVSGTHELTGYKDAHGEYHTTPFRECFEKGGLILIDEVDTSDACALKWINTALANGYAAFPDQGDPITRHQDFRIIIAANTYGTGADRVYVGANQLDASTLDRFVFFDYQYDEKLEMLLTNNADWCKRVQAIRKAVNEEKARIVVSPRATIYGAKLLGAGWNEMDVENRVIWKGMDPELRTRIEKHCGKCGKIVNKLLTKAELKKARMDLLSKFREPQTKAA
jgi:hypothetical protein